MIPLAIPDLTGNERQYLNECIDTTFVSSVGPFVTRFEEMVARETAAQAAVATSSGTTALHIGLASLGVRRDDLVIVPSFTFIASVNSIVHCGALPWFFDVTKENWTLDVNQVATELEEQSEQHDDAVFHRATGKRIAAIMPVYTLGNIADMSALNTIGKAYSLPIIADAACAIGATINGMKLGDLANISALSFNGNKTVTTGGGGALFSNDESLIALARHLSSTARVWPDYDFDMVGYNYRMTNLEAAVGCAQLERIDHLVARKRYIRDFYNEAFSRHQVISSFPTASWEKSSCWLSGLVLSESEDVDVQKLVEEFHAAGVEARKFWKPAHLQKPYCLAPRSPSLSITESLWERIITLPSSTNITQSELEYTAEQALQIISKGMRK